MRMRTSVFLLVQVTGLIFPAAGAFAASAQGYGSGEYSAPQSQSRTAQTTTRGTVLEMPAASDAAGQASSPPSARPDTPPRGMTKSRVLARYGKPVSQSGPVGQPPRGAPGERCGVKLSGVAENDGGAVGRREAEQPRFLGGGLGGLGRGEQGDRKGGEQPGAHRANKPDPREAAIR